MNRDADLKSTLKHNIKVIKKFKGRAVLYVNIFNQTDELSRWVFEIFKNEIEDGVLKLKQSESLRHWHFSWAKNSFKDWIKEDYYSSLDGDNFLTKDLVETLLAVIDKNHPVLFHGFSGKWGDGTSGQLTLPSQLYRELGYLDDIYPRQYDEIGLIARSLYGNKKLTYASLENVNITTKSGAFKKSLTFKDIENDRFFIKGFESDAPMNPRGAGYVNENKLFSYYQNFNEAYTFLKSVNTPEANGYHRDKLFNSLNLIDESIMGEVVDKSFISSKRASFTSDLTLYSVIKNDQVFLGDWLEHYRSLGVERFVIVDDYSDIDLSELYCDEADVFVFKPVIGDFKNCKVYWLELLMKAYQAVESWVLTVDSDEFLDLSESDESISDYIYRLKASKLNYSPAILLDMLPSTHFEVNAYNGENFKELFGDIYLRPFGYDSEYFNNHSIKWGFGKFAEYSYRLDSRWRFFSTFDSLRKIPIFKYGSDISLNQGFHTLKRSDDVVLANEAFSKSNLIVALKHYKFVSYFMNKENKVDGYHDRTKENLNRIRSTDKKDLLREMLLSPFVNLYSSRLFAGLFFKDIGLYRIIGNDIGGLHSEDQTYKNLEFILENEREFEGVDKIFVLNRISDANKLVSYIELLKTYSAKYLVVEFDIDEYRGIPEDKGSAPKNFKAKTKWEKLCLEVSIRETRNRYAINNNGARNVALKHGKARYKWTLPWDGNCFVNDSIIAEMKQYFDLEEVEYLITPMDRLKENVPELLDKRYPENAIEEPQISFHKDSSELFNENYFYGFQPKVSLLKRLQIPGVWENWNNIYPWRKSNPGVSSNIGRFKHAGAVYRLSSGNVEASINSKNRSHQRTEGIIEYLDSLL